MLVSALRRPPAALTRLPGLVETGNRASSALLAGAGRMSYGLPEPGCPLCMCRSGRAVLWAVSFDHKKEPMSTSESGSGEQAELARATVKTTRTSTGRLLDWIQAHAALPEKDLRSHKGPTEHLIIDGFIWHSISCVCNCCVRNDNSFEVQFNRRDFRPYVIAGAPSLA